MSYYQSGYNVGRRAAVGASPAFRIVERDPMVLRRREPPSAPEESFVDKVPVWVFPVAAAVIVGGLYWYTS